MTSMACEREHKQSRGRLKSVSVPREFPCCNRLAGCSVWPQSKACLGSTILGTAGGFSFPAGKISINSLNAAGKCEAPWIKTPKGEILEHLMTPASGKFSLYVPATTELQLCKIP